MQPFRTFDGQSEPPAAQPATARRHLQEAVSGCPELADAFRLLLALGTPVRLHPEERLWSAGDLTAYILVICRGVVAKTAQGSDGDDRVTMLSTREVAIGAPELTANRPHASAADVVLPGLALRISREQVFAIIERGGPGSLAFAGLLGRSACRQAALQRSLSEEVLERRLARLMLVLAEEGGIPDARGVFVPQRISRTRLAQLLNCRLETLVRMLRSHPSFLPIEFLREGIVVPDLDELREIAT